MKQSQQPSTEKALLADADSLNKVKHKKSDEKNCRDKVTSQSNAMRHYKLNDAQEQMLFQRPKTKEEIDMENSLYQIKILSERSISRNTLTDTNYILTDTKTEDETLKSEMKEEVLSHEILDKLRLLRERDQRKKMERELKRSADHTNNEVMSSEHQQQVIDNIIEDENIKTKKIFESVSKDKTFVKNVESLEANELSDSGDELNYIQNKTIWNYSSEDDDYYNNLKLSKNSFESIRKSITKYRYLND